ncbi:sarcolemmal membrane-associated protein isoform X2 [Patella vulgata]|uniref:sarcolemmal membrane-associated protein isoform X2 n=1 Tax=Patella vulgata TaxID=6465 RepID=UPI00217FF513|nr:sarcolemmal membrane-associated protein isoform X2 [Patella vulgata]
MVEGEINLDPNMAALAILTCRPNSHPFQERHITLGEPVKVGRSVARARPAASNGIFDCKVLSRNHALLWYENGQFYLQDTKSSNGTFVNNQRLCKGGEESPPRDIFSGDLIQFGVDVMENNRRGDKITHGCIISTITLYHPDGREAKPTPFLNAPNPPGITIQSQDLYQLAQYLQEALHREKMLEQKLVTLQQLVQNTQEASESGWQALIDEDKLLSRLEVLENQLHIYSKNHSEDTLRQECVTLQEEKLQYETTAKESLRRVLQEKLEAVTKLSELERSLGGSEDECSHLKEMCEHAQHELQLLAEKYQDKLKTEKELKDELQEAEQKHAEEMDRVEQEKQELSEKIEQMTQQEQSLSAQIESLRADNDFSKEQLAAMKAKLESIKELNDDDKISLNDSEVSNPDIIPLTLSPKEIEPVSLEEKLKETQQQIEKYKAQITESDVKLNESSDKIEQLQRELEQAQIDSKQYITKIATLEEKFQLSDLHLNQMMENALADMKLQLKESRKQCDSSNELILSLQEQIANLESEISLYKIPQQEDKTVVTLVGTQSPVNSLHSSSNTSISSTTSDLSEDESWKELLEEARQAQKKAEIELQKNRGELTMSQLQVTKTTEEMKLLQTQLTEANKIADEKTEQVANLQDQVHKAEAATKEVKQQILDLRDSMLEEQEQLRKNQNMADSFKRQLDTEKSKHKICQTELEDSKRKLQEAQQSAKQSHNEAEQFKNKIRHLQHELDSERKDRRDAHITRHANVESYTGRQSPRNKEFIALKEECSNLRKRIQAIEAEMKMSRRENLQLSSEYNKLQESYKHLEALKKKLENNEMMWQVNLTDAQKDAEMTKNELSHSAENIAALQVQCKDYSEKISKLNTDLTDMSTDYAVLAEKSKMVSLISSIPLLLLLFGFLMALYPTLSEITNTSS